MARSGSLPCLAAHRDAAPRPDSIGAPTALRTPSTTIFHTQGQLPEIAARPTPSPHGTGERHAAHPHAHFAGSPLPGTVARADWIDPVSKTADPVLDGPEPERPQLWRA